MSGVFLSCPTKPMVEGRGIGRSIMWCVERFCKHSMWWGKPSWPRQASLTTEPNRVEGTERLNAISKSSMTDCTELQDARNSCELHDEMNKPSPGIYTFSKLYEWRGELQGDQSHYRDRRKNQPYRNFDQPKFQGITDDVKMCLGTKQNLPQERWCTSASPTFNPSSEQFQRIGISGG